ncbi:NtaA/DmoA family FMN-dependent monooxygenase [Paenarthrobacter sp. NPDC057981]|uniref:NtaA/DmoA family FMN-dependent monooxygenase n=1 Tax=Paenarthrobacter sp. NPDC057981 TaxID=3346297 RepID=UPI0036DEFD4E
MTQRTMHLAIEASIWHTEGRWRLPGTYDRHRYFVEPRQWVEMAQMAEEGCLDLIFWGEGYGIASTYQAGTDAAVRWGVQWPRHDMSTMIPILSWETSHIGFVQTLSTTFYHPFHVARFAASMDHITGGRYGLNLINSARTSDFANFGYNELPSHADRYARMQEFVEVAKGLWNSIEPDAILLDQTSGVFADPSKVHRIDHQGKYFTSAGPLPVLPSPQGRPLLVQAGGSPQGTAFAARNVDVQYSSAGDGPDAWNAMREQRIRLDEQVRLQGRSPEDVKLIFDVAPVIADTEDEAMALLSSMRAVVDPEAALAYLSHNSTFDLDELKDGMTFGELVNAAETRGGSRGGPLHSLARKYGSDERIIREVLVEEVREMIVPGGCVGTPEQVADRLEELHVRGEGDGFALHLRPSINSSVANFVRGVVPLLQARGVFRTSYDDSATLRERIAR